MHACMCSPSYYRTVLLHCSCSACAESGCKALCRNVVHAGTMAVLVGRPISSTRAVLLT